MMGRSSEVLGTIDTLDGMVAMMVRTFLGIPPEEWYALSVWDRTDLMWEVVNATGYADISAIEFGTWERWDGGTPPFPRIPAEYMDASRLVM